MSWHMTTPFGQDFADQQLSPSDVFILSPKPLPLVTGVLLNGSEGGEDQHSSTRVTHNSNTGAYQRIQRGHRLSWIK